MANQEPMEFDDESKHEPEQHHQINGNASADGTVPKLILTDLSYDCLERIFDFLDIESLLKLAHTCRQLRVAATSKFGHDYGKRSIYLYRVTRETLYRCEPGIHTPFGPVRVNGLNFCFPLLRCFGAKISNLEVDYNNILDERKEYLDRYINEYCADTLTSFSFRNGHMFSPESFVNPFKCVEKIRTSYFNFGNSFSNFREWFPNLQQLGMVRIAFDATTLAVTFPHLKQLSVFVQKNNRNDFTIENTVNLLHANPQLLHLEIYFFEFDLHDLLNMIGGNGLIVSVLLDGEVKNMNTHDLNRFRREHPTIEKFEIKNSIAELD